MTLETFAAEVRRILIERAGPGADAVASSDDDMRGYYEGRLQPESFPFAAAELVSYMAQFA